MILEPKVGDRVVYVGETTENVTPGEHGKIIKTSVIDRVWVQFDNGFACYVNPIDLERE